MHELYLEYLSKKLPCLQDVFNNRIAAANVTCTLQYFGEAGEQLPGLSDACTPAEGDDSAVVAAIYAVKAGVYSVMLLLQQDGMPGVSLAGKSLFIMFS